MLVRRLARPLLGSMFVVGGLDAARHPDAKSPVAEDVVTFLKTRTSLPIPDDTTNVVRIDGIAKVAAGMALSFNKVPRLAAIVLSASLIPTTVAAHRFWEISEPSKRSAQQVQFFKNTSMLGGLILAAVDTEAKPSVAWRARRGARKLAAQAGAAAASTTEALDSATQDAVKTSRRAARKARKALPV